MIALYHAIKEAAMSVKRVEDRLTDIFRKLVDLVGYDEANALYDKAGLNADYDHDEGDVVLALDMLIEAGG